MLGVQVKNFLSCPEDLFKEKKVFADLLHVQGIILLWILHHADAIIGVQMKVPLQLMTQGAAWSVGPLTIIRLDLLCCRDNWRDRQARPGAAQSSAKR